MIETISTILVLNAEYHLKKKVLANYIQNAFFDASHKTLGITSEFKIEKFYEWSNNDADIVELNNAINHPFMNHLLDNYLKPITKEELTECKQHYARVLWETQSERNFFTHRGKV